MAGLGDGKFLIELKKNQAAHQEKTRQKQCTIFAQRSQFEKAAYCIDTTEPGMGVHA